MRYVIAHRLPQERVLIYAWWPLPVIEFWATGHNDSVIVLLITLALLAAAKERWTWAFVALSLAVAAKIWPVLLFPIFSCSRSSSDGAGAGGCAGISGG